MTPESYLKLKREDKLTDKQIADLEGVSESSLARWKRDNNVKAERTTEDYLKLREEGYFDYHIAEEWGVTPSAVSMWKARRNLN